MSRVLLTLGLLASTPFAFGLDTTRRVTQYVHDTWGVQDGLPQGSIQTLVQTRSGYLWLGTMEGLARFDGIRFTVFDRSTTPALPHNDIAALCEDRAGRLWIGTWGGLAVLENGKFRPETLPEMLRDHPVNVLAEGLEGALWIGTTKGLARRDSGGNFVVYTARDGLASEDITALLVDREGTLWIATPKGLNRLSNGALGSETAPVLREGVLALFEDRDSSLWLTTSRSGLHLAPQKQFARLSRQDGLPRERLWAVHQDRDGGLWVGTSTNGVMRRRNGGWERLSTKEGLSLNIVNGFHEDREGALWIGTDGGGLDRLRDGKLSTFGKTEGLPEEDVWTAFEDSRGTIWLGTAGAGGLFALQGGRIRQLPAPSGVTTKPIAEDAKGRLWVGGWDQGLLRLEKDRLVPQLESPAHITVLHADRSGGLWMGGEREGLAVLREGRVQWLTSRNGLPHDTVRAIIEDRQGNIWVGTEKGLVVLTGARFENAKVYTTRDGLPHDTVLDLHEDAEGVLWIGTYGGGLARFQDGRFAAFKKSDGLFNDVIYKILEDGRGRFWLSSNKGIFTVVRAELQGFAAGRLPAIRSTPYGASDGMRTPECNGFIQPAGWKARDGRLYFPTIKGVVIVDPDRIKLNLLPPPVNLEQALLNDRVLPREDGIELAPGKKNLEFQYTALSLLDPPKVSFRYLLEGFNDEWVEAGTRRVAYYTNIPPGSYRFRVVAANNDGVWNHGGVSYAFRVKRPFYQTSSFYLACASGLGLLGFAVYRLRVKQLRERQRELEALVAERTRQLEVSNAELETSNDRLERANEQLERLATEDGLTGIFNRRHFGEVLEQEWKRAMREGTEIALLMIDIDHFKKLNDAYGHPTGDECLCRVARTIRTTIHRPADLAARYGGEEFAVLLPDTSLEGAAAMGEKIRLDVEALAFPHRSSSYEHVTISCGAAALLPAPGGSPAQLVEQADRALYEAKETGRNRVVKARAEG
jgi:diguanylate cyclase (GGDEF)-like protein